MQQSSTALDFRSIVTHVDDASQAMALPKGAVVGDTYGGRSFNDNIAAVLENRSLAGWWEAVDGQHCWTLICLTR